MYLNYQPNQLYMLVYGDDAVRNRRIRMGLRAMNGQRIRYEFIDEYCKPGGS